MNAHRSSNNAWNWTAVRHTADGTVIKTYPARKTMKQVHARTEKDHPESTWDWTIDETKRQVTIFKNHWRVKEERDLARGKTQEQIWEDEAIGKCLRMARIAREMGHVYLNEDGTQDNTYGVEPMKRTWIANKVRGGAIAFGGNPPMNEADAREAVEKAFADYIAENGEE